MKKLWIVCLMCIVLATTGCVKTKTNIVFDWKNNVTVENIYLLSKQATTYPSFSADEMFKDYMPKNDINIITEISDYEEDQMIGKRVYSKIKDPSKTDIGKVLRLLPNKDRILTVNNKILYKEYVFDAIYKGTDKKTQQELIGDIDANAIIKSTITIKLPYKPLMHNATSVAKGNLLIWKIDQEKDNRILAKFIIPNNLIIALFIIILIIILTFLYIKKRKLSNLSLNNILQSININFLNLLNQQKTTQVSKFNTSNLANGVIAILVFALLGFIGYMLFAPQIAMKSMDSAIEYIENGDFIQAQEKINYAIKTDKKAAHSYGDKLMKIAIDEAENKEYKNAENIISIVKEFKPKRNPIYAQKFTEIGKSKAKNGLDKIALEYFNLSLEIDKDNEETYYQRALIHNNLSNKQQALDDLCSSIDVNETYSKAYVQRGIIYYTQEKKEKAEKDFTKVLELNNDKDSKALAYLYKGQIQCDEKNFKEALEATKKSIKIYIGLKDKKGYDKAVKQAEEIINQYSYYAYWADGWDPYFNYSPIIDDPFNPPAKKKIQTPTPKTTTTVKTKPVKTTTKPKPKTSTTKKQNQKQNVYKQMTQVENDILF